MNNSKKKVQKKYSYVKASLIRDLKIVIDSLIAEGSITPLQMFNVLTFLIKTHTRNLKDSAIRHVVISVSRHFDRYKIETDTNTKSA